MVNFNERLLTQLPGWWDGHQGRHAVSESHESPTRKVEYVPTLHESPTLLAQPQDSPPLVFEGKSPVALQPIESPLSDFSPEIAPAGYEKMQTIVDLIDSSSSSSSDNNNERQKHADADNPKALAGPSNEHQ